MINLNYTLLIQMVGFIILVILMNKILFKPILKVIDERRGGIDGALKDANSLVQKAEGLMEEYNRKVLEARQRAVQLISEGRLSATDDQKRAVAQAREEADIALQELRKRIEEERGIASKSLERFAQAFSIVIVERILGRAVESKESARWDC